MYFLKSTTGWVIFHWWLDLSILEKNLTGLTKLDIEDEPLPIILTQLTVCIARLVNVLIVYRVFDLEVYVSKSF